MPGFRRATAAGLWFAGVALASVFASVFAMGQQQSVGQQQNAREFVRAVVRSELAADSNDHSHWMFRDSNKTPAKNIVTLKVQTAQGDLSKTIEINGRPVTAQQQKDDQRRRHQFVTDAGVRRKQAQSAQQDDQRANSLTRMLPDAFLWTRTGESGDEVSLAFKPDPGFVPPTFEARVFAAMEGTMVVNTKEKRIKSLKGSLTRDVDFGYGLLGKLQKGGTFDVERQRVGPGEWEITGTHVHILGRALIFKSISEQQDEETSNYKPVPPSTTLSAAEKMLNDGTVERTLGLSPEPAIAQTQ